MSDEPKMPDDDDELPPRAWLEEWTVPELPPDLSQRVMSRIHDVPMMTPAHAARAHRSSTLVATGMAMFAAAVAAAALVISVSRPSTEPVVVPVETPAPTPAVVAAEVASPRFGHLVLDVVPGDAEVTIDGQTIAGPSPFVATNLPAGSHEIRVTRGENYEPWVKTIDVPAAELQLPITLVTKAPIGTMWSAAKSFNTADGAAYQDMIRRVVRAHINEVRVCYNQGLLRRSTLEGVVSVGFRIDRAGTVDRAKTIVSTLDDAEVESCIVEAVKRWKFPRPDGAAVEVQYPFRLEAE